MAKGMADYLCEQSRLVEREIARDLRRKEQEELRTFIEENRREIERTNRWLQAQEEAERIEPSAMFRLLKGCGSPDKLGRFESRQELDEIASAMGLSDATTATYILIGGLRCRCPEGVGAVHLARYADFGNGVSSWSRCLTELQMFGLIRIVKTDAAGRHYYELNMQ